MKNTSKKTTAKVTKSVPAAILTLAAAVEHIADTLASSATIDVNAVRVDLINATKIAVADAKAAATADSAPVTFRGCLDTVLRMVGEALAVCDPITTKRIDDALEDALDLLRCDCEDAQSQLQSLFAKRSGYAGDYVCNVKLLDSRYAIKTAKMIIDDATERKAQLTVELAAQENGLKAARDLVVGTNDKDAIAKRQASIDKALAEIKRINRMIEMTEEDIRHGQSFGNMNDIAKIGVELVQRTNKGAFFVLEDDRCEKTPTRLPKTFCGPIWIRLDVGSKLANGLRPGDGLPSLIQIRIKDWNHKPSFVKFVASK